ncbi:Transaldolase B [Seminavis robusta]|uniref:Transaldolase n=1 Tax=Seminavis robusta TaxID=568900 RepID=A0A9N8DZW9_9STRA|nr:Transaldolase B [Seminavis robusta]|eukprot:Sro487_g152780.1 Transaldolase B (392) ;mRNA; f:13119-14617
MMMVRTLSFLTASLLALSPTSHGFTVSTTTRASTRQTSLSMVSASESSQLAQLASMTTLSIDSGDLKVIEEYAATGYITDATTNPLFVSQAGLSGDPTYAELVDRAVEFAMEAGENDEAATVSLAIDRLAVNLGAAIAMIVPGYISTEVDPRLSFDTEASVARGRRIIEMYKGMGVPKERVLIKLAATWEGIKAAEILEKEGIQCNLTLIFSFVQAVACAQYGAHLISPFPGRILDWHKTLEGRTEGVPPSEDEGVVAVRKMYNYYKCHGHDTICMPASWRPSRGPGFELDEIVALAGTDRMTIPAPLLEKLASSEDPLPRVLEPTAAAASEEPLIGDGQMDEKEFRYLLNMDGCGTDKLGEGIRAFIGETEKLEQAIQAKVKAASAAVSS